MQDCDTKIHLMRILSRLKFVVESEEMNRKQLIALPAIMVATTTMSTISEASNTRWHMGIDIGMAQYKQERKQNKYPKYKDVNEILDKEIRTIEIMRDLLSDLNSMVSGYDDAITQDALNSAATQINDVNQAADVQGTMHIILTNRGYSAQRANDIIINLKDIDDNNENAKKAKNAAIEWLYNNKLDVWGVGANNYSYGDIQNVINTLGNKIDDLAEWKTVMNNLMKKQGDKVADLLNKDALKKYDKDFVNDMNTFINTDLNAVLGGDTFRQINFALGSNDVQDWANTEWYGRHNHPTQQAVMQSFNEIKNAKDDYTKLLKDIKVKRQETEKVSSGRINSPVVEANFGVTTYCGSAVFGAEMLVGINCKEFGKKKKTDTYTQKRTPVYASVIGRAGFLLGDTVEPYVLAGLRLNKTTPIFGAGARIYTSNAKSSFFKAEFQKTLGKKKKYPRGWTAKLGFGWTL